jgi:hypothetical protein
MTESRADTFRLITVNRKLCHDDKPQVGLNAKEISRLLGPMSSQLASQSQFFLKTRHAPVQVAFIRPCIISNPGEFSQPLADQLLRA